MWLCLACAVVLAVGRAKAWDVDRSNDTILVALRSVATDFHFLLDRTTNGSYAQLLNDTTRSWTVLASREGSLERIVEFFPAFYRYLDWSSSENEDYVGLLLDLHIVIGAFDVGLLPRFTTLPTLASTYRGIAAHVKDQDTVSGYGDEVFDSDFLKTWKCSNGFIVTIDQMWGADRSSLGSTVWTDHAADRSALFGQVAVRAESAHGFDPSSSNQGLVTVFVPTGAESETQQALVLRGDAQAAGMYLARHMWAFTYIRRSDLAAGMSKHTAVPILFPGRADGTRIHTKRVEDIPNNDPSSDDPSTLSPPASAPATGVVAWVNGSANGEEVWAVVGQWDVAIDGVAVEVNASLVSIADRSVFRHEWVVETQFVDFLGPEMLRGDVWEFGVVLELDVTDAIFEKPTFPAARQFLALFSRLHTLKQALLLPTPSRLTFDTLHTTHASHSNPLTSLSPLASYHFTETQVIAHGGTERGDIVADIQQTYDTASGPIIRLTPATPLLLPPNIAVPNETLAQVLEDGRWVEEVGVGRFAVLLARVLTENQLLARGNTGEEDSTHVLTILFPSDSFFHSLPKSTKRWLEDAANEDKVEELVLAHAMLDCAPLPPLPEEFEDEFCFSLLGDGYTMEANGTKLKIGEVESVGRGSVLETMTGFGIVVDGFVGPEDVVEELVTLHECWGAPCGLNGVCSANKTNADGFECTCNSGYVGARCEMQASPSPTPSHSPSPTATPSPTPTTLPSPSSTSSPSSSPSSPPTTCSNGLRDAQEEGFDCGAFCGKPCLSGSSCTSLCQSPLTCISTASTPTSFGLSLLESHHSLPSGLCLPQSLPASTFGVVLASISNLPASTTLTSPSLQSTILSALLTTNPLAIQAHLLAAADDLLLLLAVFHPNATSTNALQKLKDSVGVGFAPNSQPHFQSTLISTTSHLSLSLAIPSQVGSLSAIASPTTLTSIPSGLNLSAIASPPSSSPSPTPTPSTSSSSTTTPSSSTPSTNPTTTTIIAIATPLSILAIAATLFSLWWWRRGKAGRRGGEGGGEKTEEEEEVMKLNPALA